MDGVCSSMQSVLGSCRYQIPAGNDKGNATKLQRKRIGCLLKSSGLNLVLDDLVGTAGYQQFEM